MTRHNLPDGLLLSACCAMLVLLACEPDAPDVSLPRQSVEVAAGCDPLRECRVEHEGLALAIRLGPDIHALQPFPVVVESNASPGIDGISVAFSMRGMQMGLNRYRMQADAKGRWRARVTLPVCISGRSDWVADFEIMTAGRQLQVSVPFVLEK